MVQLTGARLVQRSSCAWGVREPCPQSSWRTALSLPEPDLLRPCRVGNGGHEGLRGCSVKGRVAPWPGDVGGSHRRVMRSGVYESGCFRPCGRIPLSANDCVVGVWKLGLRRMCSFSCALAFVFV